jgi:hypothetical protein
MYDVEGVKEYNTVSAHFRRRIKYDTVGTHKRTGRCYYCLLRCLRAFILFLRAFPLLWRGVLSQHFWCLCVLFYLTAFCLTKANGFILVWEW